MATLNFYESYYLPKPLREMRSELLKIRVLEKKIREVSIATIPDLLPPIISSVKKLDHQVSSFDLNVKEETKLVYEELCICCQELQRLMLERIRQVENRVLNENLGELKKMLSSSQEAVEKILEVLNPKANKQGCWGGVYKICSVAKRMFRSTSKIAGDVVGHVIKNPVLGIAALFTQAWNPMIRPAIESSFGEMEFPYENNLSMGGTKNLIAAGVTLGLVYSLFYADRLLSRENEPKAIDKEISLGELSAIERAVDGFIEINNELDAQNLIFKLIKSDKEGVTVKKPHSLVYLEDAWFRRLAENAKENRLAKNDLAYFLGFIHQGRIDEHEVWEVLKSIPATLFFMNAFLDPGMRVFAAIHGLQFMREFAHALLYKKLTIDQATDYAVTTLFGFAGLSAGHLVPGIAVALLNNYGFIQNGIEADKNAHEIALKCTDAEGFKALIGFIFSNWVSYTKADLSRDIKSDIKKLTRYQEKEGEREMKTVFLKLLEKVKVWIDSNAHNDYQEFDPLKSEDFFALYNEIKAFQLTIKKTDFTRLKSICKLSVFRRLDSLEKAYKNSQGAPHTQTWTERISGHLTSILKRVIFNSDWQTLVHFYHKKHTENESKKVDAQ